MQAYRMAVIALSVLLPLIGFAAEPAIAQHNPQIAPEQRRKTGDEIEKEAALAAAEKAGIEGPAMIQLLDQGQLALPSGYVYVPALQAARLLRASGDNNNMEARNNTHPNLVGLIAGNDAGHEGGFILIRYFKDGFIKDDDAQNWNADSLLSQIRIKVEGSERNRKASDHSKRHVLGWVEEPAYDTRRHRLTWSLLTVRGDRRSDADPALSYSVDTLGRDGYLQWDVLTSRSRLEADKPIATKLLDAFHYAPGKRYEDADAATDRLARYGLTGLIGGGVLREPSLFDTLFAYFEKFGRLGVLLFVIGSGLVGWFRRKSTSRAGLPGDGA